VLNKAPRYEDVRIGEVTRWRWVVRFTLRPRYPRGISPR